MENYMTDGVSIVHLFVLFWLVAFPVAVSGFLF